VREIVAHADYGIDLHTGAIHRSNLPQIRTDLEFSQNRRLAQAFGAPVILDSASPAGSLRQVAAEMHHIPLLLYEGGEALRFNEFAIRAGVRGVIGVLRELNMLTSARSRRPLPNTVIAQRSSWMRAPQSGIMRTAKALGSKVKEGEVLAMVSDPFGGQESAVTARFPGIIIGCSLLPLVNEGDALFHVALVASPGELKTHLQRYHEELTEMEELADPDEVDRFSQTF
jgi:predicted deacylase